MLNRLKPARLYVKIFLSFLVLLFITEFLVFGLFILTAGRAFKARYYQHIEASLVVASPMVKEVLGERPGQAWQDNPRLEKLLDFLGRTYDAQFWLADTEGQVLCFTGQDAPPTSLTTLKHKYTDGPVTFCRTRGAPWDIVASIPLEGPDGRVLSLNLTFQESRFHGHQKTFILGLLLIGAVVAVLVIPISRLISRRVNKLTEAAGQIARGDLSHRTDCLGCDEIGQLGEAFNHMADKVEDMVRGGQELTAHLSHELRSPLARMEVAHELALEHLEQGDPDKAVGHIRGVREDIDQLDELIGRIMVLSKLDLRQDAPRREPVDLGEMLEDLLDRYQPLIEKKGLAVDSRLEESPRVMVDPEGLFTALSNLLDNAVKYSPEGGELSVGKRAYLADGRTEVQVWVTNRCDPPASDDLETMFDPFHRWQKNSDPGSGLGLALTKKIIAKHGGVIRARYGDGRLTLELSLPLSGLPQWDGAAG